MLEEFDSLNLHVLILNTTVAVFCASDRAKPSQGWEPEIKKHAGSAHRKLHCPTQSASSSGATERTRDLPMAGFSLVILYLGTLFLSFTMLCCLNLVHQNPKRIHIIKNQENPSLQIHLWPSLEVFYSFSKGWQDQCGKTRRIISTPNHGTWTGSHADDPRKLRGRRRRTLLFAQHNLQWSRHHSIRRNTALAGWWLLREPQSNARNKQYCYTIWPLKPESESLGACSIGCTNGNTNTERSISVALLNCGFVELKRLLWFLDQWRLSVEEVWSEDG